MRSVPTAALLHARPCTPAHGPCRWPVWDAPTPTAILFLTAAQQDPCFLHGHRVSVATTQFCVTATGDTVNEGTGLGANKALFIGQALFNSSVVCSSKSMTYKPLHLLISFSYIFISLTHCEAFLPHSRANSSS